MSRSDKGKSKGHGCLGFILVLVAAVAVIAFLFFTTDMFDSAKKTLYSYFYPQKYTEQVSESCEEFGVEEALVYAVIRTESGFRPEVESAAGAVGLMQLMPSTFEWLQQKLDGDIVYSADSLKDPEINIRYGVYFLSYLIERYSNVETACAAYNSGMAKVDGWLEDGRYSPDGSTLTAIPYAETERYVSRVSEARRHYLNLYYNND